MNKSDFLNVVVEKANEIAEEGRKATKKDAVLYLDAICEAIEACMTSGDDQLSISKFGSFKVSEREARKGRNPQTGEEMMIPASKSVRFSPAKSFKDLLNGKVDV